MCVRACVCVRARLVCSLCLSRCSGRVSRADTELHVGLEGSLAAEVAMVVLDTLEHIVQVSVKHVVKWPRSDTDLSHW